MDEWMSRCCSVHVAAQTPNYLFWDALNAPSFIRRSELDDLISSSLGINGKREYTQ